MTALQNSVIINILMRINYQLKIYYNNSFLSKLIGFSWQYFSKLLSTSIFAQALICNWNIELTWKNSWVFKLFIIPLKKLNKITSKIRTQLNYSISRSIIITKFKYLANNSLQLSTRIWGLLFLAFFLTEGILWIALRINEINFIILRIILIVISFLLIIVNKPVKSFYKGSIFLRTFGRIFKC